MKQIQGDRSCAPSNDVRVHWHCELFLCLDGHVDLHHHVTSYHHSCWLAGPDFGRLARIPGSQWSSNANDVKVHWLRPQTHMEWFPHPLQTYTWCFEHSFLYCGWANGSTIMSLTPYLLACLSRTWFLGVHWLRPQTHMGWFPNPLQTYTRWDWEIIPIMLWMGMWIHIIMSLPP